MSCSETDKALERSPSGKHIVAYQFNPDGIANEGPDAAAEAPPAVPSMPSLYSHLGTLSGSKSNSKEDLHAESQSRQKNASSQGLKTEPSQASHYKSKSTGSPQQSTRGRTGNPDDFSHNDTSRLQSSPRKARRGGGGFCFRYGHQQKDRVRELLSRSQEFERPAIQQVWEPSPTGEVPAAGSPRPQPKPRTPRSPREESPRRPSQTMRREQELYRLALRIAANTRAKQLPPEASLRAGLSSSSSQRHHRAQERLLTHLQKNDPLPMSAPASASSVPPAIYEDHGFDPVPHREQSPIQYAECGIMAQSPAPESDGSRPGSRQSRFFAQSSRTVPAPPLSSGRFVVTELVSRHEIEEGALKSWQKFRLKPIADPSQVYEGHLNHFFPSTPQAPLREQAMQIPLHIPYGQRQKKTPRWR